MVALVAGRRAPDFSLPAMDGNRFFLTEALARGRVVAVFFKISCPTCQYALPFFERVHQAYAGQAVTIVGISQNRPEETSLFIEAFGITFPVLLDESESYPVSNAYGLSNVPTAFCIARDGEIEISSVGWDRKDFEQINAKVAGRSEALPIFHPGEDVAAFRAG